MDIINVINTTCQTDWSELLIKCTEPYKASINSLLEKEHENGHEIFPKVNDIFKSFAQFDRKDLKVVILGQDAYHKKGKNGVPLANGMCFSVPQ